MLSVSDPFLRFRDKHTNLSSTTLSAALAATIKDLVQANKDTSQPATAALKTYIFRGTVNWPAAVGISVVVAGLNTIVNKLTDRGYGVRRYVQNMFTSRQHGYSKLMISPVLIWIAGINGPASSSSARPPKPVPLLLSKGPSRAFRRTSSPIGATLLRLTSRMVLSA